jgi:hypothetical protein
LETGDRFDAMIRDQVRSTPPVFGLEHPDVVAAID